MGSQRIKYIDIAKAFAMLCIVAGHFGVDPVNRFVYTMHVPLFFILSGYFLSDKLGMGAFAKQKLRQLMLPYLVVGLCYIPIIIIVRLICGDAPDAILGNISQIPIALLYGSGTPVTSPVEVRNIGLLWFLPALFFALLIVRAFLKVNRGVAFCCITALGLAGWLSMVYWGKLPLSIQSGCMGAWFMYLGYLTRQYKLFDKQPHPLLVFACLALWVFCIWRGYQINLVNGGSAGGFLCIADALGASYLVILGAKFMEGHFRRFTRFFAYCGQYTLAMMVFHGVSDYCFPNYLIPAFATSLGLPSAVGSATVIVINMAWAIVGVPFCRHVKPLAWLLSMRRNETPRKQPRET